LAALQPELVKAVIVGNTPVDLDWLISWMTKHLFTISHLFESFGADHSILELVRKIADISIQIPGEDKRIRIGDIPGMDLLHIREMATMLSCLDHGVFEYHAEGRAQEFLEGFDLEQIFNRIACPVLLLQANPSKGGMMTDKSVKLVNPFARYNPHYD